MYPQKIQQMIIQSFNGVICALHTGCRITWFHTSQKMATNVENASLQGTFYIIIPASCLVLCLNMAQRTEKNE